MWRTFNPLFIAKGKKPKKGSHNFLCGYFVDYSYKYLTFTICSCETFFFTIFTFECIVYVFEIKWHLTYFIFSYNFNFSLFSELSAWKRTKRLM